jgi:hypothetical protein
MSDRRTGRRDERVRTKSKINAINAIAAVEIVPIPIKTSAARSRLTTSIRLSRPDGPSIIAATPNPTTAEYPAVTSIRSKRPSSPPPG